MQDSQEVIKPLENSLLEIKEPVIPPQKNPSCWSSFTKCMTMCWKSSKKITAAQINKQIWKKFGHKSDKQVLPQIFSLLLDLYNGKDVYETLESCRINPDFTLGSYIRNDLEFYIPQFTNFMILHEDFTNAKLQIFLHELCKTDPYFAHLFYWYIQALAPDADQHKAQAILNQLVDECSENPYSQVFVADYNKFYWALEKKLPKEDYEGKLRELETRKLRILAQMTQQINPDDSQVSIETINLRATDIELKNYTSPFTRAEEVYSASPFTSTLLFYEDLYLVADEINKIDHKLLRLKDLLHELNKSLPSCVYVPFVKQSLRHYAILNIVVEETKVFSTKDRAPFYICMELFRPQEDLAHEYNEIFNIQRDNDHKSNNILTWAKEKLQMTAKKLSNQRPDQDVRDNETDELFKLSKLNEQASLVMTLKKTPFHHDFFAGNNLNHVPFGAVVVHSAIDLGQGLEFEESETGGPMHFRSLVARRGKSPDDILTEMKGLHERKRSSSLHADLSEQKATVLEIHKANANKEINIQLNKLGSIHDLVEEKKDDSVVDLDKTDLEAKSTRPSTTHFPREEFVFFGEDSEAQAKRIRSRSFYKNLKSWRLIHLIIKSGSDMKEEQFALQLVSLFDQIFKAEKLKLELTPYELITLGPDIGVMEMIKDTMTLSGLKETMYRQNIPNLSEFFINYYGRDADKARMKFCRSLAAYSLLCYFLQIKDRHNGNILMHKSGKIVHIDFGFFLSSAPGKGLEFERKVPFKLLNEYVEVLGGPRSSLFQEFRRLFYKGFVAARKHADQIIILVKMMYSSQGKDLSCFKAGDKAITALENRFFPPGVTDKNLGTYCYNLINQSLDNWRAKCYDKYQYYFQGIFY